MTTRIYQGRIISAEYEQTGEDIGNVSAKEALINTYRIFQDAINYHLLALAGMAEDGDETAGMRFKRKMREIWQEHPRGNTSARTLQQSVTKSLNLPLNTGFDEAVAALFAECKRPDVLPYVQQLILERTQKGDGSIQQEGRSILPKLCDAKFSGNYDYSAKERKAKEGKTRLVRELNRDNITQAELEALANEMDLSWAGIKTQPNADHTGSMCYNQEETRVQVKMQMEELCQTIKQKKDKAWEKVRYEDVRRILDSRQIINCAHLLAKNNKVAPALKQAAVFFMYYPCPESAEMLKKKLGKEKVAKPEETPYDFYSLENDPILMARGKNGFIYRGYTALPEWNQEGATMYSAEWDILAFKEALKTLHSYELKEQERRNYVRELESVVNYMLKGEGKVSAQGDSDDVIPVLGGDPRFELLEELVKKISPDDRADYSITRRALNAYDKVLERWLKAEKEGTADEASLKEIVRKVQGEGGRFGSGVLFEAMCREKYRPIWHPWKDTAKKTKPRSVDMLKDFGHLQELKSDIKKYSRSVRITAADAEFSPRQLLFSDIKNFGPKTKGHEFIKDKPGEMKLRVVVRNSAGYMSGATVLVRYSAPRFERDELGVNPANWLCSNKGENNATPWLQPMMKALNIDARELHMQKEPAVAMQVKRGEICVLNFPVTLELDSLHQQIGKAKMWKNQIFGLDSEKLHLHWPGTYQGNDIPWWENESIRQNGFDVLGIDLGMRYAAAWALTHIQREEEYVTPKGSVLKGRHVGTAVDQPWYGVCYKKGLIKIDGEGRQYKHYASKCGDSGVQSPDGIILANDYDIKLANPILQSVGMTLDKKEKIDVKELGNKAISGFKRLISRFRLYQSFLVKLRRGNDVQKVLEELKDYLLGIEGKGTSVQPIVHTIEQQDIVKVCDLLLAELLDLRSKLPGLASKLVNFIIPRKNGSWRWVDACKPGCICSGRIEIDESITLAGEDKKMRDHLRAYHRGGLSVKRLEQLEHLRQALQSLNRVLWMIPGKTVPFGSELKDLPVEDPCPALLLKIENVREQRVNKIAHEIVAQALGVRLKPSRIGKNAELRDIIHGEYEPIPGRKPVDFVVLENLSTYKTNIDKDRSENSTLMRWAHRQLVAKVKQLLEEVFGIPVLCAHAAYTSRFDALTSTPGFRARELDLSFTHRMSNSSSPEEKKLAAIYERILTGFPANERPEGFKLIAPDSRNGGEFFVCAHADSVRVTNADMNAACNIAWRGIAAPDAMHLLHNIKVEKKKSICLRSSTKREKALVGCNSLKILRPLAENEKIDSSFCLMCNIEGIAPFAEYVSATGVKYPLVSWQDLWPCIMSGRWNLCNLYNLLVLKNAPANADALKEYLIDMGLLSDDDNIPL